MLLADGVPAEAQGRRGLISGSLGGFPAWPSRHDDRDLLAAVFAIEAEMGVEGEDGGGGMQLGEADEAGIREGHGQVFVFANEFPEHPLLPQDREIDCEQSGAE